MQQPSGSIYYCRALLRELLDQHGYNKSRVARESGVSRRTLNNIVSGTTLAPNHRTFQRILRLHCYLFQRTGEERLC